MAGAPAQEAGKTAKRAEQGNAFVDWLEQLVEEDCNAHVADLAEEKEDEGETDLRRRRQSIRGQRSRVAVQVERDPANDGYYAHKDDGQPQCAGHAGAEEWGWFGGCI